MKSNHRFWLIVALCTVLAGNVVCSTSAEDPPVKAHSKQGNKKTEQSTGSSSGSVPLDYVTLAKTLSDPYSTNLGRSANQTKVTNAEELISRLKKSKVEPVRSAVQRIEKQLKEAEKIARQINENDEKHKDLAKQIEEKARRGEFVNKVWREETTYNRFGSTTSRYGEWVDDGPMMVWSAGIGAAIAKDQNKKYRDATYLRAIRFGIDDAWNELTLKPDLIYPHTRELLAAIEVIILPPDPPSRSPERIKLVNRSDKVLRNATVLIDLIHFHHGIPRLKFFIDQWKSGQELYITPPVYLPTKGNLIEVSELGPECAGLAGYGGIIEAKSRLWAEGFSQPEKVQSFPAHIAEAADWDLRNITRLLGILGKEPETQKRDNGTKPVNQYYLKEAKNWIDKRLPDLIKKYPNNTTFQSQITLANSNTEEFVRQQTHRFAEEMDNMMRPGTTYLGTWRMVQDLNAMNALTPRDWEETYVRQSKERDSGGSVGMRFEGHNKTTGNVAVVLFDSARPSKQIRYVGKLRSKPLDPYGEHVLLLRSEGRLNSPKPASTVIEYSGELHLRPLAGRWVCFLPRFSGTWDTKADSIKESNGLAFLLDLKPVPESIAAKTNKTGPSAEEIRQVSALLTTFEKGRVIRGTWRLETDSKLMEEKLQKPGIEAIRNATNQGEYKIEVLDADPGTREVTVRIDWLGVSAAVPGQGKLARRNKTGTTQPRERKGRIVLDEKSGRWQLRFWSQARLEGKNGDEVSRGLMPADLNPARTPGPITFELGPKGVIGKQEILTAKNTAWLGLEVMPDTP
jgi:hypothetical protein